MIKRKEEIFLIVTEIGRKKCETTPRRSNICLTGVEEISNRDNREKEINNGRKFPQLKRPKFPK